jgi:hypothetical protein
MVRNTLYRLYLLQHQGSSEAVELLTKSTLELIDIWMPCWWVGTALMIQAGFYSDGRRIR